MEQLSTEALIGKIESRTFRVGVVGLGYVGLPLLIAFAQKGFPVLGLDIDNTKITALKSGKSYIHHIPSEPIQTINTSENTDYTTDFARAEQCDAILICVPTPLDEHREPDMSYIESTAKSLAPHVRKGQIYVLESTTYPGTTAEVLTPILESVTGLKAHQDFYTAFSPEREDPNNPSFSTVTIPKVVGADSKAALAVADALYSAVIIRTVPVSSAAAAEATKLMENIFRCVNIALVNELKMVFSKMGINIWEVIHAAKTKPFGFMPFYPGPGLGGHCIPIDPFYLTWKAHEYECVTRFIELAGEINTSMPEYVVRQTMEALNEIGLPLKGSKILLAGLAYKKNVDDTRESPTFKIWQLLEQKGAIISYDDPYCPHVPKTREYPQYAGIPRTAFSTGGFDAIIVVTDHDKVDYVKMPNLAKLVVDTRNVVPDGSNVIRA